MQDASAPFVSQRRVADSDAASACLSGVDTEFSVLAPPQRDWSFLEARLGGVTVIAARMGAALASRGCTHADVHSFVVPLTDMAGWRMNGQAVRRGTIAYRAASAEYLATIAAPADCFLLQVSRDALETPPAAPVVILGPAPGRYQRLESALRTTTHAARTRPQLLDRREVRERLRGGLLEALAGVLPVYSPAPTPRHHALTRQAHEFLGACGDLPVRAEEMRAALGVSERTLRRFFQEVFGASPARFLRVRRLHQARRMLRHQAAGHVSVTAACTAFGFYDLGRFASEYRALFGELPSQTLQAGRAR